LLQIFCQSQNMLPIMWSLTTKSSIQWGPITSEFSWSKIVGNFCSASLPLKYLYRPVLNVSYKSVNRIPLVVPEDFNHHPTRFWDIAHVTVIKFCHIELTVQNAHSTILYKKTWKNQILYPATQWISQQVKWKWIHLWWVSERWNKSANKWFWSWVAMFFDFHVNLIENIFNRMPNTLTDRNLLPDRGLSKQI
jgi:hypothetical protein